MYLLCLAKRSTSRSRSLSYYAESVKSSSTRFPPLETTRESTSSPPLPLGNLLAATRSVGHAHVYSSSAYLTSFSSISLPIPFRLLQTFILRGRYCKLSTPRLPRKEICSRWFVSLTILRSGIVFMYRSSGPLSSTTVSSIYDNTSELPS